MVCYVILYNREYINQNQKAQQQIQQQLRKTTQIDKVQMDREQIRQKLIDNQQIKQMQNSNNAQNNQNQNNDYSRNYSPNRWSSKQKRSNRYEQKQREQYMCQSKRQQIEEIQMQEVGAKFKDNHIKEQYNYEDIDYLWLRDLFFNDKIYSGESLAKLRSIGGIQRLMSILKTSKQLGIQDEESELQQRKKIYGTNNPPMLINNSIGFYVMSKIVQTIQIIFMISATFLIHIITMLATNTPAAQIAQQSLTILVCYLLMVLLNASIPYDENMFNQHRNRILFDHAASEYLVLIGKIQRLWVEVRRKGVLARVKVTDVVVGDVVELKVGDYLPASGILLQDSNFAVKEVLSDNIKNKCVINLGNPPKKRQSKRQFQRHGISSYNRLEDNKNMSEQEQRIRINFHKCIVNPLQIVQRGSAKVLVLSTGFQQYLSEYYRQLVQYLQNQPTKFSKNLQQRQNEKQKTLVNIILVFIVLSICVILWGCLYIFGGQVSVLYINMIRFIPVLVLTCIMIKANYLQLCSIYYCCAYRYALQQYQIYLTSHEPVQNMGRLQEFIFTNMGQLITRKWRVKSISISNNILLQFGQQNSEETILQFKRTTSWEFRDLFFTLLALTDDNSTNKYSRFMNKLGENDLFYKGLYKNQMMILQPNEKRLNKKLTFFNNITFKGINYKYIREVNQEQQQPIMMYQKRPIIAVQGQFDQLFNICSKYLDLNGDICEITQDYRESLLRNVQNFQLYHSYVTRILCYKEVDSMFTFFNEQKRSQEMQSDFVIVGFINMHSQLRKGVASKINELNNAGINVKLLSGTNIQTCVSISKQANILPNDYQHNQDSQVVMSASRVVQKLKQMGFCQENKYQCQVLQLTIMLSKLKVVARVKNAQRQLIIRAIKKTQKIFGTLGLDIASIQAFPHVNINVSYSQRKQKGNVIIKKPQLKKLIYLVAVGRNLYLYIAKLYKLSKTSEICATYLILIYCLFVNNHNFQFAFNVLLAYIIVSFISMISLIQMPIYISLLRKQGHNIPTINSRGLLGMEFVIVTQLTIFIFTILFFSTIAKFLKIEFKDDKQYWDTLGEVLVKCYTYLQFLHMVTALKYNNFQQYAAAYFNQSFPIFLMNNIKVIFKIIMAYMCYQVAIYFFRLVRLDTFDMFLGTLGVLPGKWFVFCFWMASFVILADEIANIAHFIFYQIGYYQ